MVIEVEETVVMTVDGAVVMVENIFRHLSEVGQAEARPGRAAPEGLDGKLATIFHASTEVTQAIFFSATIIIAGFLPLFTLSGVEGHIFGPMARTYAYVAGKQEGLVIVNITRSRRRTTDPATDDALLGWSVLQDVAGVALAAIAVPSVRRLEAVRTEPTPVPPPCAGSPTATGSSAATSRSPIWRTTAWSCPSTPQTLLQPIFTELCAVIPTIPTTLSARS